MIGYKFWEETRLKDERDRHNLEVAIAHTFKARGYSWTESLQLARAHFDGDRTIRPGDNGGPPLVDL